MIMFLLFTSCCFSQSGVSYQSFGSYWQHSDLLGYNIGFGVHEGLGNVKLNFSFNYGYGEKNGLKNSNIDTSLFHTIYVLDDGGLFGSPKVSDYAHQIALEFTCSYTVLTWSKASLDLSGGVFLSRVTHFVISEVLNDYIVNTPLGTQNEKIILESISSQNFFSGGAVIELAYGIKFRETRTLSIYTSGNIGPNKTNSLSTGLRLSGPFDKGLK
ncbi:hypothetical protein [Portibacter marinus]|uniref:hypothetical protein n=1 Tax=Portibacter marinus TaxID=2898660 RepID=UPI001F2D9BA1|nr:hypothetical protein [Portibacter marinus]